MSITRTLAARLSAAALVLSAIAAVGIAILVATATGTAPAPTAVVPAMHVVVEPVLAKGDAKLLAAIVGPGVDLPAAQAEEMILAADRVCDGFTAGVPLVYLADGVARDLGLTDEEARHFVNTVGVRHC